MNRIERIARIASKMSHPSMNVKHAFHLITDKAVDVEAKTLPHIVHVVSVSPDETRQQRESREWLEALRVNYRAGLLH